jgi:hypothetical protein
LAPGAAREHVRAAREMLYQRARQNGCSGDVPAGTPTTNALEDMPTAGQLQADALGLLAETALRSVEDLRAQNDALGIRIDPYTAKPSWQGERLDVGYAIDVMHPVALASGVTR